MDELEKIINLMEIISTALGEDINLRIRAGKWWSYDYEKNEVVFPEKLLLTYSPEEIIGFITHEVGHRQITRVDLRQEEFNYFYSKAYLKLLLSVFEDARVNNWMCSSFPGVKYYLDIMYEDLLTEDLQKSEYINHLQRQIKGSIHPYILYPHLEYILGVMYYWKYKKQPSKLFNPEVKKALEETSIYFNEIFNCFPQGRQGEKERFVLAYKTVQLIKAHILEVYKKLVNISVERISQALEEKKIKPNQISHIGDSSGGAWATIEQSARELVEKLSPKIERPDKDQAKKYIPSGIKLPKTKPLTQLTLKDFIKERRMTEKEENLSLYHKFYNETSAIIQHLSGVLENYFLKNRKPRYEGYFKSGQKADLRKAMNQSRKLQEKIPLERTDMEIFLRRKLPTEREHYIALVLDESGSMGGPKRNAALKGLLVFMEALTNLDIDHAIVGFADSVLLHKNFGNFPNQAQRASLFEEISMYIPSGMTADADALALTTELLEKQPEETMKLIIMITDGEGNINNTGKSFEELQEEARRKEIEVIGLGLGGYVTQIGKRYKTSLQIEKIEDLPRTLVNVLQEKIEGEYFG